MPVIRDALTFPDGTVQSTAATSGGSYPPNEMLVNETFNVPTRKQVLIAMPITGEAGTSITGDVGGCLIG